MIAVSKTMRALFTLLRRLEASRAPVLIVGETGTGKELVARAIHEHSDARRGEFVAINCGAIPVELAQSELFGHQRGAFTGAFETRAGAFAQADRGTLFLDEIGELPLELQPLLLRALEGSVAPVGSHLGRRVNVRVIAATNRDLVHAVEAGTFRRDLYHRLKVLTLHLPPLRERPDDITFLVARFCERAGITPPPALVLETWRAMPWPGNARELHNAVEAYAAIGEYLPA